MNATTGMATSAPTFTAVTTAAIPLARRTVVRFIATATRIESAATTCPAEIVHVPKNSGTRRSTCAMPSAGTKWLKYSAKPTATAASDPGSMIRSNDHPYR